MKNFLIDFINNTLSLPLIILFLTIILQIFLLPVWLAGHFHNCYFLLLYFPIIGLTLTIAECQ